MKISVKTKLLGPACCVIALAGRGRGRSAISQHLCDVADEAHAMYTTAAKPLSTWASLAPRPTRTALSSTTTSSTTPPAKQPSSRRRSPTTHRTSIKRLDTVKTTLQTARARSPSPSCIAAREAYATAREHVLALSNQNRARRPRTSSTRPRRSRPSRRSPRPSRRSSTPRSSWPRSGDHDSVDAAHSAELLSAILIVLAGILGFGIAFYVATSIVKGVRQVLGAADGHRPGRARARARGLKLGRDRRARPSRFSAMIAYLARDGAARPTASPRAT